MQKQQTIKCAFCAGTGSNPHFAGTCPVCRGKGENLLRGAFTSCQDCNGSGRKLDTTLTCYSCGGLGQVADRRAIVAQAAKEIGEARAEMERERAELRGRTVAPERSSKSRDAAKVLREDENPGSSYFCQSCGEEKHQEVFKICQSCLSILKKGEV